MIAIVFEKIKKIHGEEGQLQERDIEVSNETLVFEIVIGLAVVNISFIILQLLHGLLFEDLMPSFPLQTLRH
jgi:hypothetical protein